MSNLTMVAKADQELAAVRELGKDARQAKARGNSAACVSLLREAERRLVKAREMKRRAVCD